MSGSVVYVSGARPNFVKLAPVLAEMRRAMPGFRHVFVHTGQHYDRELADIFFAELELPPPDHLLGVGSGPHGAQTARALERIERVLEDEQPELVVVPGDVNSTLAGALAAAKLGIPIAHVEAGLRSFDRSMPEEINRVLTDQLSRWCFTHSEDAAENLRREGVGAERVYFVGNTMIDTLVSMRGRIDSSDVLERLDITPGEYVLVTLHRPSLVDGSLLVRAMDSLARLSDWLPIVFPVHPRTRARLDERYAPGANLRLVDPLGYVDFVALESRAAAIVTDSGGVQEESTFLGVPCFTLRAQTERPVTVTHGTNRVLGLALENVEQIPKLVGLGRAHRVPPLWDGRAAVRLSNVLRAAMAHAA